MTHIRSIHEAHRASFHSNEQEERKVRENKRLANQRSSVAKKEVSESKVATKLAIPAPQEKKAEDKDYLKDLVDSYCAITDATSEANQTQMTEFGQLQQLDSTMSQILLFKQTELLDKMKVYHDAVEQQNAIQAQAENASKISQIIGYVTIGLMVALTLGEGIPAAAAYFTEMAASSAVEGAAAGSIEMVELGAGAAEESAVQEVSQVGSEVAEAADAGAEDANADMNAAEVKATNLDWAKKGLSFLFAGALGTPQIYEGYLKLKDGGTVDVMKHVAECQKAVGEQQGQLKLLQGNQVLYQKETERLASTLESLSDELGEEMDTATDTISVYGQITEGLAQRRA